ncbi:ATP-binding cassette domain-containing protein [Dehalobacter sp. DCM]|uniref:ABC transporter ATP-binding protein n=1 Tax=Dehalobacter sp. DCM TaxID=2907827 RepID=UPI003081A386|nr:ATP-binding cassette domain-containing protein [Dehalobacter sp. DCM]
MRQPIFEAAQLGYKAGNHYILKNINWTVNKGEHWVVFGLNGSGKTTLLSIIAGYAFPTHGDLKVFGQPYRDDSILLLRRKIGWVSCSFFDKVYSKESALEIILSGLFGTMGLDYDITTQDIKRAKTLLKELRLPHKINHPYDFLSKGEQQIVLLARSLIANPQILILDEPGTGLDVFNREYLFSTIRNLALGTDMTIILITHYPEEIMNIFERCLLLKNGIVFNKGLTTDIFNRESLSSFLDYPVNVHRENGRINVSLNVNSNILELLFK